MVPTPSEVQKPPFVQRHRALVKSLTYRALSATTTFVISLAASVVLFDNLTRALQVSSAITAVESIGKVALYYAHERAWESPLSSAAPERSPAVGQDETAPMAHTVKRRSWVTELVG